jgi:hypothetical protein
MGVPVVILQTNESGILACRAALTSAGLQEGKDYVLVESLNAAMEKVEGEDAQVLVTGSLRGNEQAAADFVRSLKVTHPRLKTWYFSVVFPNRVDAYDHIITYSGLDLNHYDKLISELKKFLAAHR